MPSRFTTTEKWRDVWFRNLTIEQKLLFLYVCDNCDCAGFWEVDFALASFETGIPQEQTLLVTDKSNTIQEVFKSLKKAYLQHDNTIWLKNFLRHQKNLPLNNSNSAHKGILNAINKHNSFGEQVLKEIEKEKKQAPIMGLESPIGKGKGIGKGKELESDFEIFWKFYPKKKSKGQAQKTWNQLKGKNQLPELAILQDAIAAARQSQDWQRESGQYIPHASTWLNAQGWLDEQKIELKTQKQNLCFVDKKPADHEIKQGFLCDDCFRIFLHLTPIKTFKGIEIPKNKMSVSDIETMILKEKANK